MGELDEYAAQRKKLESRRLTYDAALSKCEKAKKEKERREAEEEVEKAKTRYEETLEDVNARMNAIRDKERMNVVRLTEFLKLEMNFVNQYLEVLNQAKSEWNDELVFVLFTLCIKSC
jgi:predicted  nucleic acid-binding Zn-ribbon protein